MARRDGAWLLLLELEDGQQLTASTDDLTLNELETAEKVAGVPWSVMNPLRSTKVARALLALLLIRQHLSSGMDQAAAEEKALEMAGQVTGAQLSDAFTFQPPTGGQLPQLEEGSDPPR
jgi:hypothetical protein